MQLAFAFEDPGVDGARALLEAHLAFARTVTPAGHVHALDLDRLRTPDISFLTARLDRTVVGVGALRRLDDQHAEVKSMHVAATTRGLGVGRAVLDHLLDLARARGFQRVSLETGTGPSFAPARALYAGAGFMTCAPFADYTDNPYSTCMTLELR